MIPYYEKNAGIHTFEDSDILYVVLDKAKVDEIDPNVWNTFDAVRLHVEAERKEFLQISEAIIALSPDGDGTYVLNFLPQELFVHEGAIL